MDSDTFSLFTSSLLLSSLLLQSFGFSRFYRLENNELWAVLSVERILHGCQFHINNVKLANSAPCKRGVVSEEEKMNKKQRRGTNSLGKKWNLNLKLPFGEKFRFSCYCLPLFPPSFSSPLISLFHFMLVLVIVEKVATRSAEKSFNLPALSCSFPLVVFALISAIRIMQGHFSYKREKRAVRL